MALHNCRPFQEFSKPLRYQLVSTERSQVVKTFIKRGLSASQCFETHGADYVSCFEAVMPSGNSRRCIGNNELSAVDQGQSFLWTKLNWVNVFCREHLLGCD